MKEQDVWQLFKGNWGKLKKKTKSGVSIGYFRKDKKDNETQVRRFLDGLEE